MLAAQNESLDADNDTGQTKLVEPAEYEKLLIGYGKFDRFYDTDTNAYGLRERETGEEYLVSAIDLYQWQLAR